MAGSTKFREDTGAGLIGGVGTRNRMIKTASGYGLAEADGTIGNASIALYERMAKGGVGLIIFEFTAVEHPRGARRPTSPEARIDHDRYIAGFKELTKAVHKHNCPIFLQIMHAGPWYAPDEPKEVLGERVSSSALTEAEFRRIGELVPPNPILPRELSPAEVEELIVKFGDAAERAQKAGFDGIEINGSHHHLVNCFFSRGWNRRQDAYGCNSLENRARFMCNIVREVKRRCGNDYPVCALFNGVELGLENGTTLAEGKRFAQLLQGAGADAIQVRMAGYGAFGVNLLHAEKLLHPELPNHLKCKEFDWSRKGRGFSLPVGAAIKTAVTVPVFLAGRLDAEIGEEALRQGKLDFVGMTRRLLADPEYPVKVAEGRLDEIAPCSGCLYCWHVRAYLGQPIRCRINPSLGREREWEIKPAEKRKKVLIAGGGPAGLEAARVAALRGHEVMIYEKGHQLGGLMPLAAIIKEVEWDSILDTIKYLKGQLAKLGVTVALGKEVDGALIKELTPEAIIVAVGGSPHTPDIPGIDSEKVVTNSKLHGKLQAAMRSLGAKSLERLTKLWMPVGKKVVIIGGGVQGCQLAEFLIKRGRKVTLVDTAETLGEGLLAEDPFRLFPWFEEKGAILRAGVAYERITNEGLVIVTREGNRETLEADSILTALPLLPNPGLASTLESAAAGAALYRIGDCRESGFMHDAIADGFRVGAMV